MSAPALRPAFTDEPGQTIDYMPSLTMPSEPWTGELRYLTPDEACAKTWRRSELAAYMRTFGLPAPGRIIEVS
jgi:hypothetical protein